MGDTVRKLDFFGKIGRKRRSGMKMNKLSSLIGLAGLVLLVSLGIATAAYGDEIEVTGDIQTQCIDNANPGDVCLVRAGTYESITIDVNQLTVQCVDGPGSCVITGSGSSNPAVKITASRVVFGGPHAGFRIIQSGSAKLGTAIQIGNPSGLEGVVVEGNHIEGALNAGIDVGIDIASSQRFLRILNNRIENVTGQGITTSGSSLNLRDVELRGNVIKDAGQEGINLNSSGSKFLNLRITGGSSCLVASSGQDGIKIQYTGSLENLYISCYVYSSNGNGLTITTTGSGNIIGLTIEDSIFGALPADVEAALGLASGSTTGNRGLGAEIKASGNGSIRNVRIRRTQFLKNDDIGLKIETTSSGTFIRDVIIEDSTAEENGFSSGIMGHGFEIEAMTTVRDVKFWDVTAKDNSGVGIRIATASDSSEGDVIGVEIKGVDGRNVITGNRHGILIEAKRSVSNVVIHKNDITNNGDVITEQGVGIWIRALNVAIRGVQIGVEETGVSPKNLISGNGRFGVHLEANNEISATTILGNDITNNPVIGLWLDVDQPAPLIGTALLVTGNTISGSTSNGPELGAGIRVDAKNVEIRKNEITSNQIGIKVYQQQGLVIRENNIRGNTEFGVDGTNVLPLEVDAQNNYWNTGASCTTGCGPTDPIGNPSGLGDKVTNNVTYTGFRTAEVTDMPDPFLIIGDTQLTPGGVGRLTISVSAVPAPGLAGFQVGPVGALSFDPRVIQVTKIEGVAPYEILSSEIDNTNGRVRFAVSNPTGQGYIVGDAQIVILTIEAAPSAQAGDETEVTLNTVDKMEAPSPEGSLPLITTIFSGRVRIVSQVAEVPVGTVTGDLNGDGALDVTDARWVAEAAIGIRTLSPEQRERADVAPPFGVIDVTDARFLAEAALGLRALSLASGVETPMPTVKLSLWEWLLKLLGLYHDQLVKQVKLAATAEGVRIELPEAAVDVQGVLSYDPTQGQALGLAAEGGWLVLAQAIDEARGLVKFAAVRLSSAANADDKPGALMLQMAGQAAGVKLHLSLLRDAQGRDLAYKVQATRLSSLSVSRVQAVPHGGGLSFRVQGVGIDSLQVEVYDLSGQMVFRSDWTKGTTLSWNLLNGEGRPVANGVYLYVVTVKDVYGQAVRSEIKKLLVLR
jgi:nitrous oxidase accessory protein NosD